MLHGRKKGSIIQWYNALKNGDVTSLAQFTDGSLIYDIVTSLNSTNSAKENVTNTESVATDSTEPMNVNVGQINTTNEETVKAGQSVSQIAVSDSPEVGKKGNIDSEKKYDSIKKCIDDFFQMDSTSLINYSECLKGNELEVAKVVVFVLMALVQNLLLTNMELTKPLSQLDSQVQEDIQEFLSFVLIDRSQDDGPIKKSEFHKIFSRSGGAPRQRQHSRSGSTDHSEASEGGKKTSKKRKGRASSIVYEDNQDFSIKTFLESPEIQQKMAMIGKESELKKLRNKMLDLLTEKETLNGKLEKKNKEVECLKDEFRKYREEAEESECFKLKEAKKQDEEIKCLKKVNHSLKEENEKFKQENETLDNKVEELELKLSEKKVPDCNVKSHMALSEKLTIRDDEIAHLKSDVKKLEKKLQSLEGKGNEKNLPSCRISKVLSNITNVNEVTKALLEKKELEIKCLWTKLLDETEKAKHFEALHKLAEIEKDDLSDEIDRQMKYISVLESNQAFFIQQQENCTCPKKSKESDCEEDEVGDMQASSTDSNEFLSRSESTFAEELGQLQSNVNNDSNLSIRRIPVELDSPIRVRNADFVLLRKMIQNMVGLIQRKNYGSDVQSLIKLENELGEAKCIQQIILAVNYIINSLKLSQSNVPNRKGSDPRVKALIIEKRGLDTENKSLKQELNDINAFLEVKEVELQVVKNECKELQSLNKELNEKIDKGHKEAEEIGEKYEDAKKSLEKKGVELRKLMRLYMKLMKSAVPDKSKSSSCDECKKLQQEIRELQSECCDKEQVIQELKSAKRDFDSRVKSYVHQVKQLQHEKAELEFKNQRDFAFTCGTLSDREKVRLHYYNKAIAALNKEEKALQKKKKAERGLTIHSVSADTYIKSGERNSTGESSTSVANQTIHSGFFQVANEEDFLNHSSLADIHKGVDTEGSNANDHLKELHGKNTLGHPHLHSSYPLVTSSEEETDSDDSSERFIKKRKMFEGDEDDNFSNASKKIFHPSSESIQKNISTTSPTSVKKGTILLKKGSTRTPSRIRHFVGMRPKNVKK